MASIFKRKLKSGKSSNWRAIVRLKGHPTVCETFERKQEAEDWAKDTERKIKLGQFKFHQHQKQHTFNELCDRFLQDGALEHHRSKEDTLRHLTYWKDCFGEYGLFHVTEDFIGKQRQVLMETPTEKGTKRSPATINRYIASLSSLLTYAVKSLGWISENPCLSLTKLKESKGRDRVLTQEEMVNLLKECRESKSSYLYCIVLISLSTGARQGEILNLSWKDIDFENQIAFFRETKNGRPRSVALSDQVLEEIKQLYRTRDPLKPLVFASKTSFGKIDIKKAWQQALKRAGISDCRAHDMRHTFATLAAAEGASNLELSAAMGHRTLQMLQRYTHLDVKSTRNLTRLISRIKTLQQFSKEHKG